jgi:hypothetical protein
MLSIQRPVWWSIVQLCCPFKVGRFLSADIPLRFVLHFGSGCVIVRTAVCMLQRAISIVSAVLRGSREGSKGSVMLRVGQRMGLEGRWEEQQRSPWRSLVIRREL